ncbi:carbohydrate ABC transporter permease [Parenemella sanctibonifatiensis]|uniref:Sugar ABC transporter permease n=1 Tax=Parenemella sanctibonifatiensis TaxID=2016505 RepID=A0A255EKC6_9ACTN|nr:carbohydrate ABC transporter permease [Parenemella sanctibonifatiensis]OYN91999.1 sugar ABC transporter permease [Parenemella sanctibonifatiensis]
MKPSTPMLIVRYIALVIVAAIFLLPFWVIVRNAFSDAAWIASPQWHWLPNQLNLDTVTRVLTNDNVPILGSLVNSAIVSVLQTAGTIIIALMAGYGMARFPIRPARWVTVLTLLTLMVPATVTFVPSFVMVSSLGWISTFRGLIIPTMFSALAAYMFRTWFTGFPRELEEAAMIDGANRWTTFWRVVVPNATGIIGAVGTITFIGAWNAYLWPLLIAQDHDTRTIQLTLSQYMTSQGVRIPELFTGALISIIPVVIVFLVLQRYLVQGVEQSGID